MTHLGLGKSAGVFLFYPFFFPISSSSIPENKTLLIGNFSEMLLVSVKSAGCFSGCSLSWSPLGSLQEQAPTQSPAPMRSCSGLRHPATNLRKTFVLLKFSWSPAVSLGPTGWMPCWCLVGFPAALMVSSVQFFTQRESVFPSYYGDECDAVSKVLLHKHKGRKSIRSRWMHTKWAPVCSLYLGEQRKV